ncbi:MAG: glycoside hydrolase family 88/105 protein [Fusobacteriaceae bacterium]
MKNPVQLNEFIMRYLDKLIGNSRPDMPLWNIEGIRAGKTLGWNYIDGCMIKGVLSMYKMTQDERYLRFADEFIDYYIFKDGSIKGFSKDEFNIDSINEGKVLFELYKITRKDKYRKAIETVFGQLKEQPRTKEGNFWHKKIYPNQVWLDGIYMALPFYMEYEVEYNNCKNFYDVYNQIMNVDRIMKDQKTGLTHHGYDESRSVFWCDKETGLSHTYWIRSLGWYVMALVDILEIMEGKMEDEFLNIKKIFIQAIDALLKYQDESGMWYQVLDFGGREGNYLETSGSAMYAYTLLKGVRLGYLNEEYREKGEKAFYGICEKYLTEKKGELNLGGICLVAGLGPEENKKRDGSYEYYISEPIVENDAKGVGPFLLAFIEIIWNSKKEFI